MQGLFVNWSRFNDNGDILVDGKFPKLENFIKNLDYVTWIRPSKGSKNWRINIKDVKEFPNRIWDFISLIQGEFPSIIFYERQMWGDPWKRISNNKSFN